MWGLSPTDNNAQINAYKAQYGITNPCAGTQGGGPAAIDITIAGQTFLGYPTFCIVCPDKTLYFDICYPPQVPCFNPLFEQCGAGTLTAHFTSDATEVCVETPVQYTDQSTGNVVSWNWLFPGGDPSSSTDENPIVIYPDAGQWDVSLTVSDGLNSNTSAIEGYLLSLAFPEVTLTPFEDVCVTDAPFMLTGGSPEGGAYSGPGVIDGWFYPNTAGIGTHTIVYTYSNVTGCTNSAEQTIVVDPCTGIKVIDGVKVMIYPNPSNGSFNIRIHNSGQVLIEVIDLIGVVVYREYGSSTGDYSTTLKLKDLSEGVYILNISTDEGIFVREIYKQ
jgi:PKD repeat protein